MERFDEHIEQLLLQKSYAQLTAEELAQVAPLFDQLAYDNHRLILLGASELFGKTPPPPSPQLEHQLLDPFDRQNPPANPAGKFERLASHQMPTWLALGMLSGLGLLFTIISLQQKDQAIIPKAEVIYKIDTIYIEVPVSQPTPILPKSQIPPNKKKENSTINKPQNSKPIAINEPKENPQEQPSKSVESSSVKKDADLLDLVVKVY